MGSFKSAVTREAGRLGLWSGGLLWERGYYDHIIRHEPALERVRDYIVNNPRQWELDRENPERGGENEFYKWLESYKRKLNVEADG